MGKCKGEGVKREDENGRKEGGGGEGTKKEQRRRGKGRVIIILFTSSRFIRGPKYASCSQSANRPALKVTVFILRLP